MPGLTNRRRAIQEGKDWTKPNSKAKGYKYGGMIVGGGSGRIPGVSESISRATKSTNCESLWLDEHMKNIEQGRPIEFIRH